MMSVKYGDDGLEAYDKEFNVHPMDSDELPEPYKWVDTGEVESKHEYINRTEIDTVPYDDVERPYHYNTGQIETIDFIEDKELNYHLGNAVKYITRAGHKSADTYTMDLKKAVWYINREINKSMDKIL